MLITFLITNPTGTVNILTREAEVDIAVDESPVVEVSSGTFETFRGVGRTHKVWSLTHEVVSSAYEEENLPLFEATKATGVFHHACCESGSCWNRKFRTDHNSNSKLHR